MIIKNINSVKWDFMHIEDKRANKDTLAFWIADMDFPCAPAIQKAIQQRVQGAPLGYSMPGDAYYSAVCNWLEKKFSWNISADDVFLSAGVVRALIDLILALTRPGEGIIIQRPVYYPFAEIIQHTGRTLVNNPLQNNNGHYTIDFADLEEKASRPETAMMIFCSPHNPVGRVWTKKELRRVAEICDKHNILLIADEIHFDLLRQGITHTPIARLCPENEAIITCTAPSKTFNTAGLQISNIIIHNKKLQKKWRTQTGVAFPSPLAIVSVEAAYTACDEWLAELLTQLDSNFFFLKDFLQQYLPKARFTIPEGTYLGWIDLSGYGYSDKEMASLLIEKANVLLEGGSVFGPEGAGFQRINVACPQEILERGLTRIARVLA